MRLSYNKLWKLMIDKNINKTELHVLTGLSQSTINKLKNGENVNISVLERICRKLDCQIGDIVELKEIHDNEQN
jgi:DNA-binding Xre family transcriptional regulator